MSRRSDPVVDDRRQAVETKAMFVRMLADAKVAKVDAPQTKYGSAEIASLVDLGSTFYEEEDTVYCIVYLAATAAGLAFYSATRAMVQQLAAGACGCLLHAPRNPGQCVHWAPDKECPSDRRDHDARLPRP